MGMEAMSTPDPYLDLDNFPLDFPVEGEADPAWLDSLLNDAFDLDLGEDHFHSQSGNSFTGSACDFADKEEEAEKEKEKEDESAPHVSSSSSSATSTTTNINFHNLTYSDGKDDDEKRKARLMRNRESAQLSRQRKKNYIDELEEKVKSANSTIAELSNTVAYLSAENVKLKQQLGALNANANPLPYYPSWPPPFPYPAYPPAVAVAGGGVRVPLLPIPKLKSSPPPSKPRKQPTSKIRHDHDHEKPSKRIKKVASVAFLGLFFFVLFLVGGTGIFRPYRTPFSPDGSLFHDGGRVFTSWEGNNSKITNVKDLHNNKYDFERAKEEIDNCRYPQNVSEPLAAALFVPRNEKLVKIDGNLIIHAVLAGEKALKANKKDIVSTERESEKTSLAIITERHRALAAARASDRNLDIQSHLFEVAAENQRALASNPRDNYRDDMKPTSVDGSLQQWFREGLAGPVLGSGMCTEVFQFDSSPNSPVTTRSSRFVTSVSSNVANGSVEHSRNDSSGSKMNGAHKSGPVDIVKNRRVSYAVPLPPARPPINVGNERNLTDHTERIHEDRGYQRNSTIPSSMVVSVLVDPLETGDEGILSSGSLPRIFVVVLIDRVKYVTYSCVLPSKGSVPYIARS